MRYSEAKLDFICSRIAEKFECPCCWLADERANAIVFSLKTDNAQYIYVVNEYKLNVLDDIIIVELAITSFEQQMGISKTFTVRILPFVKKAEKDMSFEFEDVKGINTAEYPKIEFIKASDPIQVNMVVPEGWYLVIDKS